MRLKASNFFVVITRAAAHHAAGNAVANDYVCTPRVTYDESTQKLTVSGLTHHNRIADHAGENVLTATVYCIYQMP